MHTLTTFQTLCHRSFIVWRHRMLNFFILRCVEPAIMLYGLGFGLALAYQQVGDMPYLNFVVPGIMVNLMLYACILDGAYGALTRQHYDGLWSAQLSTSVTLPLIMLAESLMSGIKGATAACIVMLIGWGFGGVEHLFTLPLTFFALILGGMGLSILGQIFAARAHGYDQLDYIWALVVTPMFLFSGTFIPVESFPATIQHIAVFFPLYHLVELTRDIMYLNVTWQNCVLHLAYMICFGLFCFLIAYQRYHKRIFA